MKKIVLGVFLILLLTPVMCYAWAPWMGNTINGAEDLDTDTRNDNDAITWNSTTESYDHTALSSVGAFTVVSGGVKNADSRKSSNPAMLISSGIR